MRRLITVVVLVAVVVGMTAPAAHAGNAATNAALGLASFAVFNQLVGPLFYPRPIHAHPAYAPYPRPVVVAPPPVYAPPAPALVAAPPLVVAGPPAFAHRRITHHPHGRYVLTGDGLYRPYRWVWVPGAPHRWAPVAPLPPAP